MEEQPPKQITEAKKKTSPGFNPEILKNLTPFNPERAKRMQERAAEARRLNTEIRETLKLTATQWNKVKAEMPKMDPLDVLEMCMVKALTDNDIEAASKYASLLAPYTSPKLQAIEQKITTNVEDMSDEDLKRLIAEQGIKLIEQQKEQENDPEE